MGQMDFPKQVLDYLRSHGPAKAKDIASALGADRTNVNQLLYGPLRGQVRQDRSYRWQIVEQKETHQDDSSVVKNSHDQLFKYYLTCLSQDDDSGVSAFADSKFALDYAELGRWPLDDVEPVFDEESIAKLVVRQHRDPRKKALWLGYPVSIHRIRSRKGWEGTLVEPLIIWPQDSDLQKLGFLPNPQINTRALRGLTASENVLEEAAELADELGLDGQDCPPLDEMAARLRSLRPEWGWKEPLAPDMLRGLGELRKISESGIYNSAVIVLADRSPFTVGLERELTDLRSVSDSAVAGSSLGVLLGTPGVSNSVSGPLLEPAPLNAEQRSAVSEALSAPLTVITGPPGTGKSQVVTALLVNAAWRGLRVLFASKNHKAVDVVLERVNALSARPIVLKLGTQALQEQLAQHITAILSARPTDDERRAYQSILVKLQTEGEAAQRLSLETNRLIEIRNRVDQLEKAAEKARTILSPAVFKNADKLPVSDVETRIVHLQQTLRRSERSSASLFQRILWFALKSRREQELVRSVNDLNAVFSTIGLSSDSELPPARCLANSLTYLEALKAASAYKKALKLLASAPDLGSITARLAQQSKSLADISSEAWRSWAGLLPDRLDSQDRTALGDYASILRTISKAAEDGSTVAKQVWRRYYQLVAKTNKAIPCWAVTSLAVRGRVPFVSGEFDLVVIDEASQCDIASALPLLYRAKRAVIIGDPQQLRHISHLSAGRDQALMVKHGLLDNPGPSWAYRANSLYDLAAAKANSSSIVVLRDHHRSHADIIGFSNRFFYGGRLRVATDYRRLRRPDGPALRWVNIEGNAVRPASGGAVNQIEADAVVAELRRIVITQRYSGEIGVVTPFRAQANLINQMLTRDEALAPVLAARNFICETAHGFQGDERDLMVFSPVVAKGLSDGAKGFLKNQGNIFNVGITRARAALVVVGDSAACVTSGVEYLAGFVRYVADRGGQTAPQPELRRQHNGSEIYPPVSHPERVSDWEKVLYSALVKAGIHTMPQYPIDQYELDLALIRENGRRLDIEVDGERYHRDWNGELVRRDQLRNLRLIEMGWEVIRFWVYEIRDCLPECVARVSAWAQRAGTPSDASLRGHF